MMRGGYGHSAAGSAAPLEGGNSQEKNGGELGQQGDRKLRMKRVGRGNAVEDELRCVGGHRLCGAHIAAMSLRRSIPRHFGFHGE